MGRGEAMIDDQHIGVPLERAAEIIGVSRDRLIEWGDREILRPRHALRIGTRRRWIYTLEDLVAGRVVVKMLEKGPDIRHVAWVIGQYRRRGVDQPLSSLRWGVDRETKRVYVQDDHGWLAGERPGQGVMVELIDLEEIRTRVRREVARRRGKPGHIVQEAGKLGSKPVFAGTRVPVESVVAWMRHGAPDRRILEAYPVLSSADLRAARKELEKAS